VPYQGLGVVEDHRRLEVVEGEEDHPFHREEVVGVEGHQPWEALARLV